METAHGVGRREGRLPVRPARGEVRAAREQRRGVGARGLAAAFRRRAIFGVFIFDAFSVIFVLELLGFSRFFPPDFFPECFPKKGGRIQKTRTTVSRVRFRLFQSFLLEGASARARVVVACYCKKKRQVCGALDCSDARGSLR